MRALFAFVAIAPLVACTTKSHMFTPLDDADAGDHDAADCDAGCVDVSVPHLRLPMNDTYLGRVPATNSLRPTFVWEASTTASDAAVEYELEYARDVTFSTDVTALRTAETSHRPADPLAVSFVPPVGARYYWRVRACVGETCSPFSSPWWVNLGRSDRDFNGNGVADIVVGAPGTDGNGESSGTAYLALGRAMLTVDQFDSVGGGGGDILGASVGFTDVNADGYADVLVGASQAGEYHRGAGYVFLGSPSSGLGSSFLLDAPANADDFGMVVPAGDVNGDGFDDVIVGAQLATQQDSVRSGRAYIYFGGVGGTFDTTPDATLDGEREDDGFGFAVGGGGDVNGDGFADVVVGAYRNDAGGDNAGRAYVYLGGPGTFDATADAVLTGVAQGDAFGQSVAIAGDVNADGFADVVIGAPWNGTGGAAAGSATVFLGAAGEVFDDDADGTILGERAGDAVGWLVASAGDVNADGFSDIVVGATESGPAGSLVGHAEIYFGGAGSEFDTVLDGRPSGASAGQMFGIAVGSAGDVNDDGFADVIVGATPLIGTTSPGAVYIYWGAPAHPFDDTFDDDLIGEDGGDRFGATVF